MRRIYIFNTILIIGLLIFYLFEYRAQIKDNSITVGILFSESGNMADSEQPVMRATLLAINEINDNGGVQGKKLIPIIYDAESNASKYGDLAKKMITEDHVTVIFGCWTSLSRKIVKPIVEKYNNLLIYPTQTEGVEESDNIIYLGATPNQQVVPAAFWMFQHYGKKAYFVGSDYISPFVIHEILDHRTTQEGGKILGSKYLPLGRMDVDPIIEDIISKKPDFIFNIFNGSTNTAFFNRLYDMTTAKGIKRPPVMSFSLSGATMHKIGMHKMIGDYSTWSYFLTENNQKNHEFLASYDKEYGSIDDVNDPAVTSYSGVYLWAQACNQAPSLQPSAVRDFMLNQSISSPAGVIYIDPKTAYAWRSVEIAHINKQGSYDIIWRSNEPIEPIVYPDFKNKTEWSYFEYQFYRAQDNPVLSN